VRSTPTGPSRPSCTFDNASAGSQSHRAGARYSAWGHYQFMKIRCLIGLTVIPLFGLVLTFAAEGRSRNPLRFEPRSSQVSQSEEPQSPIHQRANAVCRCCQPVTPAAGWQGVQRRDGCSGRSMPNPLARKRLLQPMGSRGEFGEDSTSDGMPGLLPGPGFVPRRNMRIVLYFMVI
jgi:hypothetical protein